MCAQHIRLGKGIFGIRRPGAAGSAGAVLLALAASLGPVAAAAEDGAGASLRFAAASFPAGDQKVVADTFAEKIAASAAKVAPRLTETGRAGGGPGSASGGSPVLVDTYNAAFAASAGMAAPAMPPAPAALVLHFENGSAALTGDERRKISALAREQAEQGAYLRVVGHASSRTRDLPLDEHVQANFDVSLERANQVAAELMRAGVAPRNMSVEARADSEPVYYESMPAGEAGNRRVEIFVQ